MFPQLVDAVIFWVLFGRITMYNFFTHQKIETDFDVFKIVTKILWLCCFILRITTVSFDITLTCIVVEFSEVTYNIRDILQEEIG